MFINQAYELYHALKNRKVPVQMSIYWAQGHGLFGMAGVLGSEETLAWLGEYVNPLQKQVVVR